MFGVLLAGVISFAPAGACPGAFCPAATTALADQIDTVSMMVIGCIARGAAKKSFILTNVEIADARLAPVRAFYRISETDALKYYVGRRVIIRGWVDVDAVDNGKLTASFAPQRRTIKIEDAWFGTTGSVKMDPWIPTYKFTVNIVRPLSGSCPAQ